MLSGYILGMVGRTFMVLSQIVNVPPFCLYNDVNVRMDDVAQQSK